jgi:hypothetical protein
VVVVGGVGLPPLLPPFPPKVIVTPVGLVITHDVTPGPQPIPPPDDEVLVPGPVGTEPGPVLVVMQGFAAVGTCPAAHGPTEVELGGDGLRGDVVVPEPPVAGLQSSVAVGFWPAAQGGNKLRLVVIVIVPFGPCEPVTPGMLVGLQGLSGVGSWPAAQGAKVATLIAAVVRVGLHGFPKVGVCPGWHGGKLFRLIVVDGAGLQGLSCVGC